MRSVLALRWAFARLALVLAVVPMAGGCCIYHAHFDSDVPGNPPDTTLPGLPTGDSAVLSTLAGDITVRSAIGDLPNQPVEVRMNGGAGGVDLLGTVAGTPPSSGKWLASWRGLVQKGSGPGILGSMVFRDSTALIVAAVIYRDNGIIDFNGLFAAAGIGVAWTEERSQLFELTINMDRRTTSLSINGNPVATCQNMAFLEPNAADLAGMSFEVGLTTAQAFGLDDMRICREW